MQTRRNVLASIPALAIAPATVKSSSRADLESLIGDIVATVQERDNAEWHAHQEPDFILISRKL